jgi:small-conductance mechanosensitive channel
MTGDVEKQPVEGALSLSDLADAMDEGEEEQALDESDEGEESEETEGQEESEEASDSEDEQEEPTVTLKHDGKEVVLKQSEVIELAQKGFDYTKKTMVFADEKKALEAEKSQVDTYRKQHEETLGVAKQRLQALEQYLQAQVGSPPPVEWASQDVAYYLAQKELHESQKDKLRQAKEAIQQLDQEAQRTRQARLEQAADETEKALRDTLPGWNDEMLPTLAKYAESLGITPESAGDAFVHKGLWLALHKAKAFDAIQADKAKLKPKNELQRVQKPSAANQPNRSDARKAEAFKSYKAKPSLNTLADLMD